jgi:transcriptional regulator with GAF, ATPase, and Fis domain
VLLQNKIIRLSEGHAIPPLGQIAKGKYCKWHDTFSHTTNECNYFCQQVQSALNDNRLTLGEGQKMKLDTYPFPMNVNMINFEEKRVLVRTSQADSTQRKNVIVLDEPRLRMVKPRNPEPGQWQVNKALRARTRVKPTLDMLLEKYAEQQRQNMFQRLGAETIEITPARTTHREEEVNGASQ